jgi:hypothetical protein
MTLKEKFESIEFSFPADESVKIADDFAIGFAEWCTKYRDKNRNPFGEMLHAKSKYDETYLTKELLEMYKKEKGL